MRVKARRQKKQAIFGRAQGVANKRRAAESFVFLASEVVST